MKNTLKRMISKSKILNSLKILQRDKIIIFNYHRIRDRNVPTCFDDSVFGPDANRFRDEMEWIKKETRILSEVELIDIIYSKKSVKELCSLITFDDGYRDNFDLAYPILKQLEIPAIFFIPTYSITERKVGWWDVVAYLLKHTKRKHFTFQNHNYEILDQQLLIKKFIDEIKSLNTDKVEKYLISLSDSLEQEQPSNEIQCSELMTWNHIKTLSDNGMSIGTHSHDHSILSKQDRNVLKAQLEKSIIILESTLNCKINSIAYPVGGYNQFNQETKDVTADLGLKLGFSYLTGINVSRNIDPFNVKRISTQPEWFNLDIPLAFPGLFLKHETQ